MTIAYIYKWTHIPTLKWYIGSRTGKNCHPDDGYICSSNLVKPLIKESPIEWKREILFTGNPIEIRNLEGEILSLLDAKNDDRSYNQDNGDGNFVLWAHSEITKKKMRKPKSEKVKGNYKKANQLKALDPVYLEKLRKPKPEGHGRKVSEALKGKLKSDSHKQALSKAQKLTADKLRSGKSYSEIFGDERSREIRQKMSISQKGKPNNNPIVICPHCNLSGPSGAMNRWHFNNCKHKK